MSALLTWLTARDNAGLCILAAIAIFLVLAPAIRNAFRAVGDWADRNVEHMVSAALDPVDTHFATLPDFLSAPTFTDLRADWGQWEKEVSA